MEYIGILSEIIGNRTIKHVIDIKPCPAPRMTRSDKWKLNPNHIDPNKRQRPAVTRYFQYKNEIKAFCLQSKYTITPQLKIIFIVEMPSSWSNKKRLQMNFMPHQVRPDIDNFTKAFLDSILDEDGFVYDIHAIKLWGVEPKIIILHNGSESPLIAF